MAKSNLPKSIRKFLRREKAKIRGKVSYTEDTEKKITELMERVAREYSVSKNKRKDPALTKRAK